MLGQALIIILLLAIITGIAKRSNRKVAAICFVVAAVLLVLSLIAFLIPTEIAPI